MLKNLLDLLVTCTLVVAVIVAFSYMMGNAGIINTLPFVCTLVALIWHHIKTDYLLIDKDEETYTKNKEQA